MVSIERLKIIFRISPTGTLEYAVKRKGRRRDGVVGCLRADGYIRVKVDGESLYAHRIVYAMTHGFWPDLTDHKNCERGSNNPGNLRDSTPSQNRGNTKITSRNRSGFKGVSWHTASQRWYASIQVNRKSINLGLSMGGGVGQGAFCHGHAASGRQDRNRGNRLSFTSQEKPHHQGTGRRKMTYQRPTNALPTTLSNGMPTACRPASNGLHTHSYTTYMPLPLADGKLRNWLDVPVSDISALPGQLSQAGGCWQLKHPFVERHRGALDLGWGETQVSTRFGQRVSFQPVFGRSR